MLKCVAPVQATMNLQSHAYNNSNMTHLFHMKIQVSQRILLHGPINCINACNFVTGARLGRVG